MKTIWIILLCVGLWQTHAFFSGQYRIKASKQTHSACRMASTDENALETRKELWKKISNLEREAVELLSNPSPVDAEQDRETAYKLLAQSVVLKKQDPFVELAEDYSAASLMSDDAACSDLLIKMEESGLPPHIDSKVRTTIVSQKVEGEEGEGEGASARDEPFSLEDKDVDLSSTFSDTVTEKIRVKVNSFYDSEKSDPANGKFMFWYKVAIYNEGPEPVQIVARMWEIEKVGGTKETVRGAGVMSTQPIIPAGDMFTYQSVCPLKVFPPEGKRVLGSMAGAYTICKGNMGQVNFSVKVGKFMLILPEEHVA